MKQSGPFFLFIFFLFLSACSKSNDPSGGGSGGDTATTMSIKNNQTISGFPHAIDEYIPSNATSVIIFLHGGGGKKEGMVYNLGLKSDDTNSSYALTSEGSTWLINNKVAAVFPQGQQRMVLSWTWNNYVMDSGENDVAFLQALVAALRTDSSFSKVTKFYLVGHSNGGMMTNRMWCESPGTFDAYGAIAGPPASALGSAGAHPCNPTSVKPYIGLVGNADSQLQTSGNMNAATWSCINYNAANSAWVSGTVLNEKNYHTNRVTLKCGGSPAAPVTSGQVTTYTDCGGSISTIVITQSGGVGGDHCLKTVNAGCSTTLAGNTGIDYKTTIFNFLKNF